MMYTPQRRSDDGFLKKLSRFFKGLLMSLGALLLLSLVSVALLFAEHEEKKTPAVAVLSYTFKPGLAELAGRPSLAQPLLASSTTFHDVIDTLEGAAKDARVKGFVARLQGLALAPAQIQELRDTIAQFRAAGKFTAIYADDLGGFGGGMGPYYLSSSFSQIWLQPVGAVAINGVSAEVPFFKGILDKVGVSAEFRHKGIYKSMPESLTETGMTAPHREMMTGLVADLSGQIIAGIAADRKMTVPAMKEIVDAAPYTGEAALKLKLIDKIGYYEDMVDEAKHVAGAGAELVALDDYTPPESDAKGHSKIALITGAGDIISGGSETHVGLSGGDMAADKISKAFADATKDKSVVAAVFRIDSPGGSPEAAETIRHAVMKMQKKGKPVIVSMGGYAASGGYWVATPADKIVAEPATLTGSIGVFGGKFVLSGLWDKLGIHWESVSEGANARMWSSNEAFTDHQKASFDALLGGIYDGFIARVAEGRKMTPEAVRAVAEGHVWTGRQAKERGLVDELGGVDKAIALAKTAAKLPPDKEVIIKQFPERKSPLELLFGLVTDDAGILPLFGITADNALNALQNEASPLKMQEIKLH